MESFLPLGGFQLPFQRRLSRLYNDTKKSSDFVKEPVSEDPEIKAMHRKLKIQKDRLVSWGLEWSDPSNQNAEIDESLSKAGLSDLVGSIMSTIKDILAEAEPLWLSSKRRLGSEKEPEKTTGDKKIPIVVWDKARFEDLIKDLTVSIDTLHDLSRTRSSAATSRQLGRLSKSMSSTEELRPFGSTRIQTPQQIPPESLTNLKSLQAEPIAYTTPGGKRPQEIVFMNRQAYSDLTHRPGRQPWSPLLLEYAQFDPIYSTTGIMPSMSRFERLSTALQDESHRSPAAWIGLPLLLGFYEDMENSRLGLVYQFPASFNPVTFENLTQNPIDNLCTLAELLSRPDFEPRLEAKFRLAHNLANTVFDMHARGITHGNLLDSTISFCSPVGNEPGMEVGEVDIRKPLISSFDIFPDEAPQTISSSTILHRHPLDPRTVSQSPLASNRDTKTLDLYSLAMILVSIGLWTKLENLVPNASSPSIPESVLEQLAIRCGTLYMRAVQVCWNAVEQELTRPDASDEIMSQVQIRASRYLEACSILDGVSGLDDRISEDISDIPISVRERQPSLALSTSSLAGPSRDSRQARSAATTPVVYEQKEEVAKSHTSTPQGDFASGLKAKRHELTNPVSVSKSEKAHRKQESSKLRLYPQISLPPEAIEQWNDVVMPQVNMALRHFCRKHMESVEITLESIGESPQKTTPTVLVVCTSVNKVRAILKKKLGILFDGTTPFVLKVCRGSVVRSRKGETTRSMASSKGGDGEDEDESLAANPGFQPRPQNGASIGAWIGDRHLPPVSFGGLITVDEKTYGMTVHHMLDDQEQMQAQSEDPYIAAPPLRSSAAAQHLSYLEEAESSAYSSGTEDFACEFSDEESDYSVTDFSDDEDEDEEEYAEDGDIPGVEPGCGEGYIITQPALDDVEEGFYPSEETKDEDHLDTYRLGEVYASSGIRRRHEANGYVHEVDWALFEFEEERFPLDNHVPRVKLSGRRPDSPIASFHPTTIAPSSELPGLEVQCSARTSGLQVGKILPAIASIKIYGRTSLSQTYQVSSKASTPGLPTLNLPDNPGLSTRSIPGVSLGIPGDSGAWIIDRLKGKLCGHVLAWSQRKQVAYISPMDILIKDIAETLEASEVRLGGQPIFERNEGKVEEAHDNNEQDLSDLIDEEDDDGEAAQEQLAQSMRNLATDMRRMRLKTEAVS